VVERVPSLHTRTYEPGDCVVLVLAPGHFRVRFRTQAHLREHFRRYQGPMTVQILETCGARDVTCEIVNESEDDDVYTIEHEVHYRKG
jgi:hypothetical protein